MPSPASVLTPAGDRLDVKLYGDLAEIVALSEGVTTNVNGAIPGGMAPLLSVIAGTRNHLYRTRVNCTFRR